MPSLTYNGQSFAIDGRRLWVLGASIQYSRVPAALWKSRIAAAKQAGFNTIETACPWVVHEPRKGRLVFDGDANVRQFVQLCGSMGMRVILRPGPYIGHHFDGGGLPGWLIEMPDVKLREDNGTFLEHVSRYFRRLLGELSDLQISSGGPIILVQSEHAWTCSNPEQAASYLNEITRFIRENGITVPVINANDLWQDTPGTIDTWRGYNDLLAHLRQLRTVQPSAPRLVSEFTAANVEVWGDSSDTGRKRAQEKSDDKSPQAVLRHLAEVLAGGAQPIVTPFHAGTNFGFLAGRVPDCGSGFVTTQGAVDPPLGQAGTRGRKYHLLRRLVTFANHFAHVFAELDPDYQPIVLDPEAHDSTERGGKGANGRAGVSVVPLRGPQGRIVFVFAPEHASAFSTTLVLDDGVRLPVQLGDQSVGWYALDVDLQGVARLDYSNICPWAMINRSIVVFQGPAGAPVYISISGTPLEATVPADDPRQPPLVLDHKGLAVVICSQAQIDSAYQDEKAVYFGIAGFDESGHPVADERCARPHVIRKNGKIEDLDIGGGADAKTKAAPKAAKPHVYAMSQWQVADLHAFISGQSPRYASLEGPETLSECGAPSGYGWYRVNLKGLGRVLCNAPQAADRLHIFVDGAREHLSGVGPAADTGPFELRLTRAEQDHVLVALVDNLGRFSAGNELGQCKGLWGDVYAVKPLRPGKPKEQTAKPINPFALRGFISGLDAEQLSDTIQAVWTFAHTRKTPLLIDVTGARCSGTFVLNDKPIAYHAGATGGCNTRILLDEKVEALKRGKNVLRFAPDVRQTNAIAAISKATTIYGCLDTVTSGGWSFAKWEPPPIATYNEFDRAQTRAHKGQPCWWRATVEIIAEEPHISWAYWLDVSTLSKGQAYFNGQNLGRYFTATGQGKAVGPQTRLYVPQTWVKSGQANEIVIFDEHGFEATRVRLIYGPEE